MRMSQAAGASVPTKRLPKSKITATSRITTIADDSGKMRVNWVDILIRITCNNEYCNTKQNSYNSFHLHAQLVKP